MKATKLTVSNIGIIADAVIEIDKPLIIFYGDIMQGKTTLLNSLKWVMGGSFPDDILRHGASEAFIQFEAAEEGKPVVIRREWYRAKDQSVKARAIVFTRNGCPVKNPVNEIGKFLNPFLLDQDYLRHMNDRERTLYLIKLFAVDTAAEDKAIAEMAAQASDLRAKVKGYGEIDMTPVDAVDVAALQAELSERRRQHANVTAAAREELRKVLAVHESEVAKVDHINCEVRKHNQQCDAAAQAIRNAQISIEKIDAEIARLNESRARLVGELTELSNSTQPRREETSRPPKPDTSAIQAVIDSPLDTSDLDQKLRDAGAQNVRHEQYQKNQERAKAKAADEQKILDLERGQREMKAAKATKLAALGDRCGVAGLAFCEDGSFAFEGVSAGMLSDSQIMRLSQALSGLYPEGFGISLIDRGESMGRSVLDLWKTAQEKERTILVTVVGDKPARIPEQVGAFVIEQGQVKPEAAQAAVSQ